MTVTPSPKNKIPKVYKNLHEIDGVALDADSYARHIAAAPEPEIAAAPVVQETQADTQPAAVFAVPPVHVGWYEPAAPTEITYPIMAGAVKPHAEAGTVPIAVYAGSGSSSYLSSFLGSYQTSWATSYHFGSGSWMTSGFYGSAGSVMSGGFGLELI